MVGLGGRLAKLTQNSTVAEYQSRFEALERLSESFMMECFHSGLRPDIQSAVVAHEPQSLDQLISLAHIHEQRIALEKGPNTFKPTYSKSPPLLPTPTSAPLISTISSPKSLNPRFPLKRLSPAEAQQR